MSRDFGIILAHPGSLLREEEVEAIAGDYLRALENLGGTRWAADSLPDDAAQLLILVATGGSERAILDLRPERQRTSPDEAVFLVAHPGNNSLPASLEVLARLQQDGEEGRIFYLSGPDDEAGLLEIAEAVADVGVQRSLRRARIGLVGDPSDWLVASMPDEAMIKATWGPSVVPVDMSEVVENLATVSDEDLAAHVASFTAGAAEVREPSAADVQEVARIYLALKKVVTDHQLEALTVRCFEFVQQQRTTGCFGLAQLADEGIIAGCEGDLVSTVGLLWAQQLLGVTPWMANPAQLDPARNTLWLAHCTVPRTLVEGYRLRSHFESGLGVGIQGTLPTGPVTLLRIGGRKMDRLWLAQGEILRNGDAENLCRTQVEIRLDHGGSVIDLLRAPFGNHLVLVFGHHLERLQRWCEHVANDVVISGAL
jgi:L-fucose isomerase-like protein